MREGRLGVMVEDLYGLVNAVYESEWADVPRCLKSKAMPMEAPARMLYR